MAWIFDTERNSYYVIFLLCFKSVLSLFFYRFLVFLISTFDTMIDVNEEIIPPNVKPWIDKSKEYDMLCGYFKSRV